MRTRLQARPLARSARLGWLAQLAFAVVALIALVGCTSPCAELAERTCKRAGDSDAACQRLRVLAQQPSEQDLHACRAGQAFLDDMERR